MSKDESAPKLPPQQSQPRPSSAGARRVGDGQPQRVTPARQPIRPAAAQNPPSYQPGGQSAPVQRNAIRPSAAAPNPPRGGGSGGASSGAGGSGRSGNSGGPGGPARPTGPAGYAGQPSSGSGRRIRPKRLITILLIAILAWPIGLAAWASVSLNRVDALSDAPNTKGTTHLLVGSDSREGDSAGIQDGTEGQRSDTIILLNRAPNGQTAMISLPRDTLVSIPDYGDNKLNASFALGGAPLLVRTVEGLTGLTVDHYVEIGMGGLVRIVDAVGGVELCLDYDVNDEKSELVWTAGCHMADGRTALAFSRMRYSDPIGDIGRGQRQRQVISQTMKAMATPSTVVNPIRQARLATAGVDTLAVGEGTNLFNIGTLAWAFMRASSDSGFSGAPPIASMGYDAGKIGSVVLLSDASPDFFARLATGQLVPEDFPQP